MTKLKHLLFRSPSLSIAIIFLLGFVLRVVAFYNLFPGINQDEASTGYEAFSLFHTGFDRWGNDRLPVYLMAWGSGQSVLPAYLIAPVVGFFGISTFTIRILPFLMNVALLLIFFSYLRRVYEKSTPGISILGLAIFALSPWHIMVSVWNLECNLAPFFLALAGLLFESSYGNRAQLAREAEEIKSRLLLCSAAVALGLSLYCYLAILPVVLLMAVVMILRINGHGMLRKIFNFKRDSLLVSVTFLFVSWPIIYFVVKNHVIKSATFIEQYLPFSVPLLLTSRLNQIQGNFYETLAQNWKFISNGFQDGLGWNHVPGQSPIQIGLVLCAVYGFGVCSLRFVRSVLKGDFRPTVHGIQMLGSLFLFLLIPLNINRVNALWIPLLVYAAVGMNDIYSARFARFGRWISGLPNKAINILFLTPIMVWVAFDSFRFLRAYYFEDVDPFLKYHLRFYLKDAMLQAQEIKEKHNIAKTYYSDQILWAYLYEGIHLQIPPVVLRNGLVSLTGPHKVEAVGNSYYQLDFMLSRYSGDFVFVIYPGDKLPCRQIEEAKTVQGWEIGVCRV